MKILLKYLLLLRGKILSLDHKRKKGRKKMKCAPGLGGGSTSHCRTGLGGGGKDTSALCEDPRVEETRGQRAEESNVAEAMSEEGPLSWGQGTGQPAPRDTSACRQQADPVPHLLRCRHSVPRTNVPNLMRSRVGKEPEYSRRP